MRRSSTKSGGAKTEAKVLNFYNWTDYIADDTIPNFQKETGIKVVYDNYSSNDELFAKVRTGGTGFDIIVPTDATLVKMKHANLLEKLDLAQIPNVTNLAPRFRNAAYDPGNKYSIPWQWGTTGIGFDKTKVAGKVTDWDAFDLPAVSEARARSSTRRATRLRWRCSRSGTIQTLSSTPSSTPRRNT